MAEEVDADDRKCHLSSQEGPAEGAAAEAELKLLVAPAAEGGATGTDEAGT